MSTKGARVGVCDRFLVTCISLSFAVASWGGGQRAAWAGPPAPVVVGPGPGAADLPGTEQRARRVLWSGVAVGALGLVAAGAGFGMFGAVHAANPGPGLSLQGTDGQARRDLQVARVGAAVGYTGLIVALVGGTMALVGGRRLRARRSVALVPGLRGALLTGRF